MTRLSRLFQKVTSAGDVGFDARWIKVTGVMVVALIVVGAWLGITVLRAISSDDIRRDAVWA